MLKTGLELGVLVEVVEPEFAAIDVAVRNRIDRLGHAPCVSCMFIPMFAQVESSGGLHTTALAVNAPLTFTEKLDANVK
jgi:hypothetical protein